MKYKQKNKNHEKLLKRNSTKKNQQKKGKQKTVVVQIIGKASRWAGPTLRACGLYGFPHAMGDIYGLSSKMASTFNRKQTVCEHISKGCNSKWNHGQTTTKILAFVSQKSPPNYSL
jgi:hypothetical protein